jgi:hypothetical protein
MGWTKLGRVFAPVGHEPWARGYAAFPTAESRADGSIRIFYTALDDAQQGRTGWLEVAGEDPVRVVRRGQAPLLELGEMGDFDESGANVFSSVEWGGRRLYHYQGWQRAARAPYLIFTGAAVADSDDGPLRKLRRTPVLDRTPDEPFMRAAPWVLADGARLRMWYVNCVRWRMVDGAPRYFVDIRSATSEDGIAWAIDGSVCLAPQGDEYAVGRPSVLRTPAGYEMWFSVRSTTRPYHLAHAVSADGLRWTRSGADVPLVEASAQGWDSAMVCYPCVIEHGGQRLIFYNGNQHGRSGFGVARWQD